MKILYIVPNPPSLVRVRPYNLIRYLIKRGHQVTIATTWTNEGERRDIESLKEQGITVLSTPLTKPRIALNLIRALMTGRPLQAEYSWQPDLKSQISNLKSQFDVIHVEHLRGARYGRELRAETLVPALRASASAGVQNLKSDIPVVWDSVDCITYLFEQASRQSQSVFGKAMTTLELGRTRRHEGWLVNQFDQILATSETDKKALERLGSSSKVKNLKSEIHVLPNGVDLEYFTPVDKPRQPDMVVFSGKMSYHANVTAALYLANEVMPLVWAQRPGVHLIIAGSQPTAAIQQLAEKYQPHIEVTGFLPDLRLPLRQAMVAVAPLRYGAGIQNKVLEAMACETPVVASSLAVKALQTHAGTDCLVADSPPAFAEAILQLLGDQVWREQLGTAGRRYVEMYHDWAKIAAQLEAIYQRSMKRG